MTEEHTDDEVQSAPSESATPDEMAEELPKAKIIKLDDGDYIEGRLVEYLKFDLRDNPKVKDFVWNGSFKLNEVSPDIIFRNGDVLDDDLHLVSLPMGLRFALRDADVNLFDLIRITRKGKSRSTTWMVNILEKHE